MLILVLVKKPKKKLRNFLISPSNLFLLVLIKFLISSIFLAIVFLRL